MFSMCHRVQLQCALLHAICASGSEFNKHNFSRYVLLNADSRFKLHYCKQYALLKISADSTSIIAVNMCYWILIEPALLQHSVLLNSDWTSNIAVIIMCYSMLMEPAILQSFQYVLLNADSSSIFAVTSSYWMLIQQALLQSHRDTESEFNMLYSS